MNRHPNDPLDEDTMYNIDMRGKMTILTTLSNLPAPVNAALRHVYTGVGVATIVLVGVGLSQGDATGLGNAVHQIGEGISSIAAGISAIVAIVSPLYAAWTATQASRKASVAAMPNTMVVTTDKRSSTAEQADKIATMPAVESVLSTPEVAKATTSDKVVAP